MAGHTRVDKTEGRIHSCISIYYFMFEQAVISTATFFIPSEARNLSFACEAGSLPPVEMTDVKTFGSVNC